MLDDIPRYNDATLAAVDIFLFEFNDFLIYVEDEGQENLYLQIFRKIIPTSKIENIFPLNGKENILTHWRENKNERRPTFYLLDKDYDDLLNKIVTDHRLIYLGRYSIENYFVEAKAVMEIIISEHPKVPEADVANNLQLGRFVDATLATIRPLVRAFFLTQLHDAGEKGCGLSIEEFTSKKPYILDSNKIEDYEKKLFGILAANGVYRDIEEMRRAGDAHISFDLMSVGREVCGKHLMALLKHWLSSFWDVKGITAESFCYRLASRCDFESLKFVADRILANPLPDNGQLAA